jgi:hypothetical protein
MPNLLKDNITTTVSYEVVSVAERFTLVGGWWLVVVLWFGTTFSKVVKGC